MTDGPAVSVGSARCWILGGTAWDRVVRVSELPGAGDLTHASSYVEQLGGTGANVAVGLARAGAKPQLVTYVGQDSHGDRFLQALRDHDVSDNYVHRLAAPTQSALVLVESTGVRTIIVLHADVCDQVPVPTGEMRRGDIVFVVHPLLHGLPQLAALKEAGVRIVSTPASDANEPLDAEIVLGSATQLSDNAVRLMLAGGVPVVIRTLGADGAEVFTRSMHEVVPAPQVMPINTTGAGDAFAAGLLLAMACGAPLRTAVEAGVLWGTRAVESEYSVAPAPPKAALDLLAHSLGGPTPA